MQPPKNLAILGRQPELGLLELESRLGADVITPIGREAVLVQGDVELSQYGGIVKLGQVVYDGQPVPLDQLPADLSAYGPDSGKVTFGLSLYGGKWERGELEAAARSIKNKLRERGSVRWVKPTSGLAVSTVQLHHNHVLERGFELVVVKTSQRMVAAITTASQDINWYSRRDYDRPARSAKVGMLPPKLAQVLINTTSALRVADPFCGTGVVLQEALLVGRQAWGSDLAPEMVAASQQNLAWLAGEVPTTLPDWTVAEADARTVELPPGPCSIVSEGYLGTNLTHSPAADQLAKLQTETLDLYRKALGNLARQLPSGAEVSICVPAWRTPQGWRYAAVVDELADLGYTTKVFKHVRGTVLYARPDATVGRQLLLLRKN